MKQDIHAFQGMRRDNHPIRQESKYLWEAHNIRFTARDDNTLLAMTNERGPEYTGIELLGQYVGHCVLGDYIVVFTYYKKTSDNYIYRIYKKDNTWKEDLLYKGNLKMDDEHLAQTLGIYEGNLVQKVYWVDGKNQPRVINIMADKLRYNKDISELTDEEKIDLYPSGCFDFVQELNLEEEVTITRQNSGGTFSPGTIQYAFSYYNKYGQESNLFYTTALYNTSFPNRGGSPEDVVTNSFNINIKHVETKFQYIRVYSIHRTSLDSTPIVKVVTDIEILNNQELNYIDTGTTGYNEDSTKMLYIGGESIIANTIAEKDNTLFLGNIKLIRRAIPERIKEDIKDPEFSTISTSTYRSEILEGSSNPNYSYKSQLSSNTSSFKIGDTYRLGVQFQHITGKWSEPCWIKDFEIPRNCTPYIKENLFINLPCIDVSFEESIITRLKKLDYKKVRPLIVVPSIRDRTILAQGIICPTMFSVKDRVSNTPFAQSSWFFRPIGTSSLNDVNIEKGATLVYSHLEPPLMTEDRGCEIQNIESQPFEQANYKVKLDISSNVNSFFVDQSIVTFHSPDIEFDEYVQTALQNSDEYTLDIVGVTPFKSNCGDISIQTSSAVPAPNDEGFFHKSFISSDFSNKRIVSGMFYKSHLLDDIYNNSKLTLIPFKANEDNYQFAWMIYPWHRSGSLNNDTVREDNTGTRTSVLKRKVISNLAFSPDNIWLENIWKSEKSEDLEENKEGITAISIFNSNEVSLIKIPSPKNSNLEPLNYYGNVDSLITTSTKYPFILTLDSGVTMNNIEVDNFFTSNDFFTVKDINKRTGVYSGQLSETKDPVRMKYKSTPHAVFAFNYSLNGLPITLPKVKYDNIYLNKNLPINTIPFWISKATEDPDIIYKDSIEANFLVFRPSELEGTMEEVEKKIIKTLEGRFPLGINDDVPYCICPYSSNPSDTEHFDLYKSKIYWKTEGEPPSTFKVKEWSKVKISGEDYTNKKSYKYKSINGIYVYYTIQFNLDSVLTPIPTYYLEKAVSIQKVAEEQSEITLSHGNSKAFLFLGELRRKNPPENIFGGEKIEDNTWIPAGEAVDINKVIPFKYGDTYYQRYDCLKTYPFTSEDENNVVEIASFMCETRINIDGRYDRNRGQLSNLNMSPTNFNLLNKVYSQKDNFFNYRVLENNFYRNVEFPTQILWSLEKSYLEDIDTWTNITLANSIDISGSKGPITSIEVFNGLLLAFQDKSINQILFNNRVQIPTSDGSPVEITNNYKVEGIRPYSDTVGCQNKWSIAKSPSGIYFIDNSTDTLYLFNGQLQDLSTQLGSKYWLRENHQDNNSFIRLSYDSKNRDLYLSPKTKDAICYSEQLGQFTSLMSYTDVVMFPVGSDFFSLKNESTTNRVKLWENFKGDYNNFYGEIKLPDFTYICNEDSIYTKIFDTIEYRADVYNKEGTLIHNRSFDWIRAANEYQDSGIKSLTQSRRTFNDVSLRKKFRIWRGQIPRQGRERIRNPWTSISLGFNKSDNVEDNNFHFILHDISTKYTI